MVVVILVDSPNVNTNISSLFWNTSSWSRDRKPNFRNFRYIDENKGILLILKYSMVHKMSEAYMVCCGYFHFLLRDIIGVRSHKITF